jgi:hypothetical protein
MCLCTSVAQASHFRAGPAPSDATQAPVEEPVDAPVDDGPTSGGEDPSAPPSVDDALEAGDLSIALEQARMQREADPSAANWRREAQVLEQMGQLDAAARAYEGELEALPAGDERREGAQADLERVRAQARGAAVDEPPSTHREQLDERWSPKADAKKMRPPRPEPPPPVAEDQRIVRKWYFWVTIAAITAAAAAVTGIAVKAARDRRRDALDLTRDPGTMPPPVFRF